MNDYTLTPFAWAPIYMPMGETNMPRTSHKRLAAISKQLATHLKDKTMGHIFGSVQEDTPIRLKSVALVNDIEFIDDSGSSNANSCWYALDSSVKPTILITEAEDKEVDYQCLEGVVREQCNGIIVIGQSTPLQRYLRRLNVDFTNVDSISEAVQLAYKKGNAGDCVIYSPCCKAADDAFALRSQRYTKAVRHL